MCIVLFWRAYVTKREEGGIGENVSAGPVQGGQIFLICHEQILPKIST